MVSQMAHAKNIGEPFMAHAKKLYSIPWNMAILTIERRHDLGKVPLFCPAKFTLCISILTLEQILI